MAWLGVKYVPLVLLAGGYYLLRADKSGRATLLLLAVPAAGSFAWFHLATFGDLTPYSVNVVYAGSSTGELLDAHVALNDRFYRLWGLFIDRRFGIARWAPFLFLAIPGLVLLLRQGAASRLVLALIAAQVGIATFVAITMMGWWFPGRTLMTVLPLFALPAALLLKRASRPLWLAAAVLAAYSAAITGALAHAGLAREVVIAVDPFEMSATLFRLPAHLFPQYTSWGAETRLLTAGWLALAAAALTPFAWGGARTAYVRARNSLPLLPQARLSAATRTGTREASHLD